MPLPLPWAAALGGCCAASPASCQLSPAWSCLLPSSVVRGLAEFVPKQCGTRVLQDAPCGEVLWLHSADSSSLMAPGGAGERCLSQRGAFT